MVSRSLAMCAVLSLTLVGVSAAEDIYVRAGAEGKGSKDAPYGELWKAVDRAKRGDVIHVAKGVYNGKGGCGHFVPKVPDLTMVGGYSDDFSTRDPFTNHSILQRAEDYKGDWTGLPDGVVQEGDTDCSRFILDGFVLDCKTRNSYSATKINPKNCYKGPVLGMTKVKDFKIRNCTLLNPYGNGIYCGPVGEDNEISNCFIVNTFYAGLSTRSAQPDSVIKIANNTIVFGWFQPGKGGHWGIYVGNEGQAILENNVVGFLQTEGDSAGVPVINGFGNEDLIMKNNALFGGPGGLYKYMDADDKNLVVWKESDLADLNDEDVCEDYMLLESGGNTMKNPGLKADKDYMGMFLNFVGSEPGKLTMDEMNEWRQMMGLPLQAADGSPRENWALPYPLEAVNGLAVEGGKGVQLTGPFATYAAAGEAEDTASYEVAVFTDFKKGAARAKGNQGTPVILQAGMGDAKTIYEIDEHAPRSEYDCFQVIAVPGKLPTRDYIPGYLLKGSEAHQDWLKYTKKRDRYNKKGIWLKGKIYDFKNQAYSFPVGFVITEVSRKEIEP